MELVIHVLTHWGRVTHICVTKQTIIGSDNGLSPGRRQAIIWTNAGTWLIQILGTNFNEILNEIQTFSENALQNVVRKMAAILPRPQCVNPDTGLSNLCQWKLSVLTKHWEMSDNKKCIYSTTGYEN